MSENKISDLEHKLIYSHIENLEVKIHEGFGAIAKAIDANFEIYRAENKAENEKSAIQREQMLKKQDLTNGRVKSLEEVTGKLKFLQANPKISILLIYGIYNVADFTTVTNIFKFFTWLQSMI